MAKKTQDFVDAKTGEVFDGKLNEVIIHEGRRPDGSWFYATDYTYCPTMAEQHTAHLSDINYLMEKYKPDELAAYIQARNQYRQEILNHDFSTEPTLQEAQNIIYKSKQEFLNLPEEIRTSFANHLEFLKFIDNPQNVQKMIKLGLLTLEEVKKIQIPELTGANQQPNAANQQSTQDPNQQQKSKT